MKGLSLRQPWCDTVFFGGKDIENRTAWSGSAFRGPLILHAAKGMTMQDYEDVVHFLKIKGLTYAPPPRKEVIRGVLRGVTTVVDVVMPGGLRHAGPGYKPSQSSRLPHPRGKDVFYMGEFALVLEKTRVFADPIPFSASLGFFEIPEALVETALTAVGYEVPKAPPPKDPVQLSLIGATGRTGYRP